MSVWPESGEGAGATVGEDIDRVWEPEPFLGTESTTGGGGIAISSWGGQEGGPISITESEAEW